MSVVLMYHSLYSEGDTDSIDDEDLPYAVSTENFVEQLDRLKNKRVGLLTGQNSVVPEVVISFDDGHVSNFDIAMPLLAEKGLSAYFFVTSDYVGRRKHFCSADQLAQMAKMGMHIGSHGKTHRFFDDLSDAQAECELRQSMQQLSEQSGQQIESISYPGGRYSQRTLEISRKSGYSQLFGSTIGVLKQTDLSANAPLKRVAIRRTTSLDEFDQIVNTNATYYAIEQGKQKAKTLVKRTLEIVYTMASTNPFRHADADAVEGINESIADVGVRGHRARQSLKNRSKSRRRIRERKAAALEQMHHGLPAWEGLRPVLLFLMAPALLAIGVALTGPWDFWILYGLAGLMGLYVFASAFKSVELVLACFLLYVPFSTTYVVPVAPGVNGTNMLIVLGLFASVLAKMSGRVSWLNWPPGTTVVFIFGFLSALSGLTILREPGGYEYLLYTELLSYKAWLDQFVMYFVALSCIRNIETAKRVVVYMCIGTIVLSIYTIPEMLDKVGGSTIEKSRIGGPHQQPNMFGGFLAYSILPIAAIFVTYIKDIRAWLFAPYFLLAIKLLITTFSRGAYLAMAVGGFLTAYYKGKGFLAFFGTLGICLLLIFPSLFPDAVKDRLFPGDERVQSSQPEKLDKSSEYRIILWRAGGEMIIESPILGKGFKGFPKLKGQYTEIDIWESDPHNTYIYIASQMGLPALVLFLLILGYSFHLGRNLSRNKEDLFIRAIGIGGASATVCYAVICMFGSRAINLEFTSNFWAYLVCMQVIDMQLRQKAADAQPKKRRTNAYEARLDDDSAPTQGTTAGDGTGIGDAEQAETRLLPSPAGQRKRKRSEKSMAQAREKRRRLKHHRK